ncbi:MAG: DNA polymerase I [Clostridium sp.]|nr:DNA polymerase I [Clostridium sp.]
MEEKRLFLLDAYALIYRAYYALIRNPRITSKGVNVSAVFGFCNTLDEILRKENPTHIAVCFDPVGGTTFRHEMYSEYKAGRDKQPEDITLAVPLIKELLAAYRIPVVEVPGYEADDVIGTLSRMAEKDGYTTYMMTPDKDYGQLVTDRVMMYRPSLRGEGFEIRGPREVCERYGISRPSQVIDLLALEGDASDNIPGCPGVGEKTAVKLIAEFDNVANLIEHADSLKGALQKKIKENADKILFSKDLATIRTDAPLGELTVDDLVRREENPEALADLFGRLEFRTFLNRLRNRTATAKTEASPRSSTKENSSGQTPSLFDIPAEEETAEPATPAQMIAGDYTRVDTVAGVLEAIEKAARAESVGFALLSRGAAVMQSSLVAVALSDAPGRAVALWLPEEEEDRRRIIAALTPLFSNGETLLCGHDIKRSILLLRREGIDISPRYFDTAIAHYLIEPEMKHTPDWLATKYLDTELPSSDADMTLRACALADIALRLRRPLSDEIGRLGLTSLMDDIELPFARVLASMEWEGVRIDVGELRRLSEEYTARLSGMEEEVYRLAGTKFNIGSPAQVGEILFDRMQINPSAKRTKKGAYSTTEEILSKYRHDYPIVDLILKIRALKKLLATYIDALPSLINPETGKIHTTFNQTLTATGRISSADPNLQNIPIRTDDGREIRRAFVADPGDLFMSADYSQIELRLMADFSGDPHMIEAFLSGADIHRATAAKIYHIPLDEVTDNQRRNAKTANFGIIYGISAFGLSERLGIPRSEAKMLIEGYLETYPKVKEYMERNVENARRDGYVTTVMGRRRLLPDINSRSAVMRGFSERNAVNAPLQGSAADIIKRAMIDIDREISARGLRSRMIMQVHDELIFNVVPEELTMMQELVVRLMESAYSGRVPLEVSAGVGSNWLEAH